MGIEDVEGEFVGDDLEESVDIGDIPFVVDIDIDIGDHIHCLCVFRVLGCVLFPFCYYNCAVFYFSSDLGSYDNALKDVVVGRLGERHKYVNTDSPQRYSLQI